MKNQVFLTCLISLLSSQILFAEDEDPGVLPIGTGDGKPIRSKLPSRNQINCYVNGEELVIESHCEVYGFVTLIENNSGNTVIQTTAMLYPEYRVELTGLCGSLTIYVNVEGVDYSTTIIL